ncbi:MAG: primosomal protein N' [Chlamydiia bacterium]|nr:primosomal protein N' [Chlamydiia bacterium]
MLTYAIPKEAVVCVGKRVRVPLGKRLVSGTIWKLTTTKPSYPVKPIHSLIDEVPQLSGDLIQLAQWMANYYCCPLHNIIQMILPSPVRKNTKQRLINFVERKQTIDELIKHCEAIRRTFPAQAEVIDVLLKHPQGFFSSDHNISPSALKTLEKQNWINIFKRPPSDTILNKAEYFLTKPKKLNEEQHTAFAAIKQGVEQGGYQTHLIHGITGSGKTEIYLQAIQTAFDHNKGVIFLVPEVSLATQMVERLKSRFPEKLAILHHRLSDGDRMSAWKGIEEGRIPLVVGARSAIFSPMPHLGLIIVDEEHERAYKNSENMPTYHARDIACIRGQLAKATVILGSATPSVESFSNAQKGKYLLHTLAQRADTAKLPTIHVVDMRLEYEKKKGFTPFSDQILSSIESRYTKGEQTILFLNRRGYHTSILCLDCEEPIKCTNCDISLTFHSQQNILTCHLCGLQRSPPKHCPTCHSETIKYKGIGTELVQKSLQAIFPNLRIMRIDADTTRKQGAHEELFRKFATGKADVLVGTQMIAKGLHFPEVTLVGVLQADSGLNIPDFRAQEHTLQLLVQVAGRAGRGARKGEVIIQTLMPDHPLLHFAAKQDYTTFLQEELTTRETFSFPPFSRLVKLTFSGPHPDKTLQAATILRNHLSKNLPTTYLIYPVTPCPHSRIKNRWRYQFLIRGSSISTLSQALKKCPHPPSAISCLIDINPVTM